MRTGVAVFGCAAILLLGAGTAWAGGLDRLGTSGAQELRIPTGAAAIAMGGAGVAQGDGLTHLFWNPAALASTDNSEAIVSYSTYLADSKVNYGAVSTKVGSAGMVALSAKVLNIGDITVTTEDAPEGTGQILNPNFAVIGVSYGRRMTDRVLLGATGMFINERVADVSARGVALDLGVQYDTGWRGLRFGFAMKNIGPNMRFDGGSLEERIILPDDDPSAQPHVVQLEATSFELPSYLQIGAAYDLRFAEKTDATVVGAFQGNNFSTDEYRLGAEFRIGGVLALRGGFQGQLAVSEEDRQTDYLYNFTYGAGFNFKLSDHPLNFDWAGTHVGEFFGDNQQFSLRYAF
jgi:Type IX secretion system protein PorV